MNGNDDVKIAVSHISDHFIKGYKNTHPISQPIQSGGKEKIAYTEVGGQGRVGKSGFAPKK